MSHIWHCKKEPWKQKVIEKTFWWSSIRNTLAHVTVVTHRLSSFIKNAFLPHHPWWSWNMGDDELSSDQSSQRSRLFLESYQVSNEYHRLRSMEIWAYDVTKPVMKMQGNQGRCMLLEMLDSWLLVNRWVFSMLWYAKRLYYTDRYLSSWRSSSSGNPMNGIHGNSNKDSCSSFFTHYQIALNHV